MREIFTDEQVSIAQQDLSQLVADGFSVAQQPPTVTHPATLLGASQALRITNEIKNQSPR